MRGHQGQFVYTQWKKIMRAILKEIYLLTTFAISKNQSVPCDRGIEQCVRSTDVRDLTFDSEKNDSIGANYVGPRKPCE